MPKITPLTGHFDPYYLGFVPSWLVDGDPTPLTEQLNRNYGHGGGWKPFKGFTLQSDNSLTYWGDPDQHPFAMIEVEGHEEKVFMYPHAWVAIIWPDRRFEVCRMD